MSEHPDRGSPVLCPEARERLDTLLRRISFRTEVFFRGQLCGAWGLDTSGSGKVSFHLVGHGDCWLHLPYRSSPLPLPAGTVAIFPHDCVHSIASAANPAPEYGERVSDPPLPIDPGHPGTALICGYIDVEPTCRRLLLAGMPEHLVIDGGVQGSVGRLMELLFNEAARDDLAATAVLERLADALLLLVIRTAVAGHHPSAGLLGALQDPLLWPAVSALLDEPARHWSLEALAERAHLSRTSFAQRFRAAAGASPIEMLTQWRMYLARGWLESERLPMVTVAERCGYGSEAAFAKAFKRAVGINPGELRRSSWR